MKPPPCIVDRWQLDSKTEKVPSRSPGQGNLVDGDVHYNIALRSYSVIIALNYNNNYNSIVLFEDTALPTARHRCDISSIEAVLPGRNDVETGPQPRCTIRRNTASIMKDLIFDLI